MKKQIPYMCRLSFLLVLVGSVGNQMSYILRALCGQDSNNVCFNPLSKSHDVYAVAWKKKMLHSLMHAVNMKLNLTQMTIGTMNSSKKPKCKHVTTEVPSENTNTSLA